MEASEENPLALPMEEDGLPHQLQLTQPDGVEATRRINICTIVLEYLATTHGMGFFNGLTESHQITAILIIEGDNAHTRLDQFV